MDERLGQMNEQMGLLDKHLRRHAEESKSWHRVASASCSVSGTTPPEVGSVAMVTLFTELPRASTLGLSTRFIGRKG
jgi:hypothetical protein